MADQARPKGNLFSILGEMFGVGGAQAASPGNPFGPGGNVLPFHRPGTPLGEGGGGFAPRRATVESEVGRPLAPQGEMVRAKDRALAPPPRRFEEIMRQAEEVMGVKRPTPEPRVDPSLDSLRRGAGPRRDPTAGEAGLAPKTNVEASFVERRQAQLQAEQAQRTAVEKAATDDMVAAIQAKRAARTQAGEQWLEARGRPQKVTPELVRERTAERNVELLTQPSINSRGLVEEMVKQGHVVQTNPRNGASRVRLGGMEVPFRSRAEALEWLGTKPTPKQMQAKAELQRQRLRGSERLLEE